MKEKLLNKIVKKDLNNSLERVLSKKNFSVDVENTLLSMFYKIENGYDDYNVVKRETFEKKEYITNLINIIDKNCENIKFITKRDDLEESVDIEKKEIICKPIEINLLYDLSKIRKKRYYCKIYR